MMRQHTPRWRVVCGAKGGARFFRQLDAACAPPAHLVYPDLFDQCPELARLRIDDESDCLAVVDLSAIH